MNEWRPTASLEMLTIRARLLSKLRVFFADKDVLEVQTPILSHAGNTEPAISSFITNSFHNQSVYLNTSPEFLMKRLLAAGSGSIYQIAQVFRQGEQGQKHNPEFSLLEWYRVNFDHHALMSELDSLIRFVAAGFIKLEPSQFYTYQDAMLKFAGVDPFNTNFNELKQVTINAGIDVVGLHQDLDSANNNSIDTWLDLLMSQVVEKKLPENCPVFIYNYPVSQAALAKISETNSQVAERFELYINGLELANGFNELRDAAEQQRRFKLQQQQRQSAQLAEIPADTHLIEALKNGLPECAGVAVGLDRLLMLLTQSEHINEVLSFHFDIA